MTTVIVKIPDGKENLSKEFFKKHHLKTRVLKANEDEQLIAKWIDEGMTLSPEELTSIVEEFSSGTLMKNS